MDKKAELEKLIGQQVRVTEWDFCGNPHHAVGILSQPDVANSCFDISDEISGEVFYSFDWFTVDAINLRNRAIYLEEPSDMDEGNQNFYDPDPDLYDPADPDAEFPGVGEE
ncbi:MAG: hypothetical protein HS114_34865 [Anaerolineales bacterium]|nr:hypothetical protein [Anaerolineales bacterium]